MLNLAVIGAGVGGCSAAYFARKYFPDAKITIYEGEDRIGGRILTQTAQGASLEFGAAFFNSFNKIILDIVNTEKLGIRRVEERSDFAVWNGSKLVFRSSENAVVTDLKLLYKYRLSITRALGLLREAKLQVNKLYWEQAKNPAEISVLFEATRLNEWYSVTFNELLERKGISQSFIDEVVSPVTRTIYSQNAEVSGFAGISALIGVYGGPIYSFIGGNSTFPEYLANASGAKVKLNQKVTCIEKNPNDSYCVSTADDAADFDCVILATPIEVAGIALSGIRKPDWAPQSYQTVYKKVMQGVFNPAYFGLRKSAKVPAIVLTTKDADPLTHCSIQRIANGESLVTFSSPKPITDEAFNGVFTGKATPTLQHCWQTAYPIFNPVTKLPPTQLDDQLYYLNSIETSVSSMETTALSALNAIQMLKTNLPNK